MPETYDIDADFNGIRPKLPQLMQEIDNSAITETFLYPRIDNKNVKLFFTNSLNIGDKTILDGIVAAHNPVEDPLISIITDGSYSTVMTIIGHQTADRTITLPDATTTLVGMDNSQTLTNKNITSTNNNITAKGLHSATTTVSVSGATAPTSGQVLTATSSTNATWQTPSGGGSGDVTAASNITNNALVIGNGGVKGVKSSSWTIDSNDKLSVSASQSGYLLEIYNSLATGGGNGFKVRAGEVTGDISFSVWDQDLTFPIMEQEANTGHITFGKTYAQTIIDNGIVYGLDNQHNSGAVDFNTQNGIYRIAGVDVADVSQSFTNKTITSTSNNVVSKGLHSSSTVVNVSSASAPSSGQVLTATSSTNATWQSPAGDVAGPSSTTDMHMVRFDGTSGKSIESVGIKHYGISSTNPTSPAPSSGDKYYNTDIQVEMTYDGFRGKWLSTSTFTEGFGINGTANGGAFYRRYNGMTTSTTLGPYFPPATLVGLSFNNSNSGNHTLEILNLGSTIAELSSNGGVANIDGYLNADISEGVVSARNKVGSVSTSNLQCTLYYKIRI